MGRYAARPLAIKIVGTEDLERAENSAKDIDVMGLILARPVPAFAELSTLAAGITKMPFKKFIYVMILSNIGVAVVFSGLGAAALSSGSSTLAFFGAAYCQLCFTFFIRNIVSKIDDIYENFLEGFSSFILSGSMSMR